jgi:hypothetical protein
VIEVCPNRDYLVRTENGKEFRQNHRHPLHRVMPGTPGPAMTHAAAPQSQHATPTHN